MFNCTALYTDLPDTTEISQVEDVVKLGRCRQHLRLRPLPQLACGRHQLLNPLLERLDKPTLLNNNVFDFPRQFNTGETL